MKIYTVFTESHYDMFKNYFIKSFPFESNLELVIKFKPQLCKTAEFTSDGWKDTMMYKVDCFIDAINETKENECFIFSDPDIQFFNNFYDDLLKELGDNDAAFQNDYGGGVNTGFFIMRSTPKIKSFLNTVKANLHHFPEEQACFNYIIRNFHKYQSISFDWKMLPKKYWTYGEIAIQRPKNGQPYSTWEEGQDFEIPKDILLHHANWTTPFSNKIKILDIVKQKYENLG
jgi:hypothetical protein